jgi:Tfp pilus assembly protein PilN
VLRTNLSTRPFYNERGVHAVLVVVAAILIAVTAWQVMRIVSLSRQKTELSTAIRHDRAESEKLTREAAQTRRGMNQQELALVSTAAKEANALIEQRTFSWTALFNQLESTLPEDVMLMSVRPTFRDNDTILSFELQGKRTEDVDAFMDNLEATGLFHDVRWSQENVSEEGLHRVTMQAQYVPPAPAAPEVRPQGTTSHAPGQPEAPEVKR